MKCYWIKGADRTIIEATYNTLRDIQTMIGGHIECARMWPTGDVLYVDEEGLLKPASGWFTYPGARNPIQGNGLVVGREIGGGIDTADPTLSLDQLAQQIEFLTQDQVDAWARANSSDPFVSFHSSGEPPTVVQRVGEAFGVAPKSKPS